MDNFLISLNTIFPMVTAQMTAGFLVFARLIGFIRFAPVLNRKEINIYVKLSLAFILTILIVGILKPPAPPVNFDLFISVILNIIAGSLIGFIANVILLAIDAGGDMINMQMGLSSATVLDPTTQSQTSILGKELSLFGLIIFLEIGGAYWLFQAILRTFYIFPIYSVSLPLAQLCNLDYLISLTSNVLYMGLQIASPVLLATLGQDIILGVISRTAPQINVFQLSFLFKPVLGAAIMIWILPMLMGIINDYFLSFSNIF